MTISFNKEPYWDDYDEEKGYHNILFRPGFAVQTRELNQLQTMLQKQVERHGRNSFREGSIVLGGGFDLESDIQYAKINAITPENNEDTLKTFVGKTVVGQTSGIEAYVRSYYVDSDNGNFVVFLRYSSSSQFNDTFLNNENIELKDDSSVSARVLDEPEATGRGSLFSIDEGVFFAKGYFIAFDKQTVVIDPYDNRPNVTIGFDITETIVTSNDDESLLDNAQGTFNFAAPGGHRLLLGGSVTSVPLGQQDTNPSFVSFLDVINGIRANTGDRTQFSRVYEEVARRSYDVYGDFYVRGYSVRSREYLDTGENEGYLTPDKIPETAAEDVKNNPENYLSLDIEPGLAYVKGYEINNEITEHIVTDKSLDFRYVNDQVLTARTGGYLIVDEAVGTPILDKAVTVELYDTAENRVSEQIKNTVTPTGTLLGTAKIKSIEFDNGIAGTAEGRYRLYLFDIDVDGDLSNVKSVHFTGTTGTPFFADTVTNLSNVTEIQNIIDNDLIFPLNTQHTREIRDDTGVTDTSFIFQRSVNTSVNLDAGNGEISLSLGTTNESLPFSDGVLSSEEKRDFIVTVAGDQDFPLTGTANTTSGSSTVLGSSTQFELLNVGDRIKVTDGTNIEYLIIESIVSDTELEATTNAVATISGGDVARTYFSGDLIDLTVKGSTGVIRSVTVLGNSSTAVIDLQENTSDSSVTGTIDAVVNFNVQRSNATEIEKKLRPSRFVKIDCSSLSSLTDPIDLGFSDVLNIRQIRIDNSSFTSDTQGSEVTNQFAFHNGQFDNYYDHATITPRIALTTSDHLLVELDYFEPVFSGSYGYFSIDSYPIDDTQDTDTTIFTFELPTYTNSVGTVYELRNSLDFRPVKQNTANDATDVSSASSNPSSTESFIADGNGLRIAAPNSRIDLDYSYYIARRDVVTLNQDGQFSVVRGEPAEAPITPTIGDNVMGIANVYIPPFPSISATLGRVINRRDIAVTTKRIANIRHTQREIGVLKQRIDNLEYYNALSLLEKNATELQVLDETGLDRFKNGVFVDGFMDHTLGDTKNIDYNISIDKIEQVIRPTYEMDSYKYQYVPNQSSGVSQNGNLITLPFTETPLVEQLNVTTIRNIEQSVFRYIGTLELSPDTDVWVDTNTVDKTVEFGNDLEPRMETEWGSWETNATGYNVYRQEGSWSGLKLVDGKVKADADHVGTFSSYADAVNATRSQAKYLRPGYIEGVLEPFSEETRTGIQTSVTYEKESQQLGSFVTDVSLIPYIRPQQITIYAQGLKNNTNYYVFFDGEDVTQYVTPYTIPSNGNLSGATLGSEGDDIRSDEFGDVYAILRLPSSGKRFRVGNREIVVTDSPTNDPETTSYASEYFYASGVDVQKQNTILSTKTANYDTDVITDKRSRVSQNVKRVGPSCMAYSFLVDVPPEEEGIFLTSVDVFIESMHPELGVWFEIREIDAGGNITRTQVPYSKVWMRRDDPRINFWDGTGTPVATNVDFEAPIFLYNDTQYAFVIHTEGLNPDTYFWVSRLGEEDIITGEPVTGRQLTGTLFTTNNNLNYDIVPDLDLMVRFNRAQFQANTSGQVVLGNRPYEFMTVSVPTNQFTIIGEEVEGSDLITLGGVTGTDTIVIGDTIIGSTSTASGTVVDIIANDYYTDGFGFENGELITVEDSGGTAKDISASISSITSGSANLKSYDSNEDYLTLSDSNGEFFELGKLRGVQTGTTVDIQSFINQLYSTTNVKPDFLNFNDTSVQFEKRGFNVATNSYTDWVPGAPDATSSYDEEVAIISRTNEQDILGSNDLQSSQLRATFQSLSQYVSPVVDLSRAHAVYVHNIINDDTTDEDSSTGGNLTNKYISKIVTLDEGQDAEDLIVFLSSYRPPIGGSDIKVWMRVKHREDSESINDKEWIEMVNSNPGFSSLVNQNNFIESEFTVPESNKGSTGITEYQKNGTTFTGFKQYQVKIGLVGTNSAVIPRVGDLRALALQL